MEKIVIIGGGAGGLELATKLGHKLGKKKKANITLIDKSSSHLWKPLLHEVASGSLDANINNVDYGSHGVLHHYHYQQGEMTRINADNKFVILAPILDEQGKTLVPERHIPYHTLVIALGSTSNDFNTAGVKEHCYFLDSSEQAKRFHRHLMNQFISVNQSNDRNHLNISIVGGGATGVELSAELFHVAEIAKKYGLKQVDKKSININLIEASPSILSALPKHVSDKARTQLKKIGVNVLENTQIKQATSEGFIDKNDTLIKSDIMLWAAGVKAPDFLKYIHLFEHNKLQQIICHENLKAKLHENIYVIGDCCGVQINDKWIPPRAQSAHQMANTVAKNIVAELHNKPLKAFKYKDHGSLVNLSTYSTVGSLMGNLKGSLFIEGKVARFVYISLYRMHQMAIHGKLRGLLTILVEKLNRAIKPKLKVH